MKRLIVVSVMIVLLATACLGGDGAEAPTTVPLAQLPTAGAGQEAATTLPTLIPSPTAGIAPTLTPLPAETPTLAPDCVFDVAFVADVAIPDDTAIPPGVQFNKTWRILNSGTCAWPAGTQFVFDGGSQMGALPAVNIPPTEPGETVDVTVNFLTPAGIGTYTSYWRVQLPQGELLPQRFFTRIIVPTPSPTRPRATAVSGGGSGGSGGSGGATSTPAATATAGAGTATATAVPTVSTSWVGEYYDNKTLDGTPRLTRAETAVDFVWGTGSPSNQIPSDGFSARWTRSLTFAEGTYQFEATMDDGMRVFIDGTKVLEEWRDGAERTVTFDYWLSSGTHTVVVEYYESVDKAVAQFSWGITGSSGLWNAQYWSNKELSGAPVVETQVAGIDIEWGLNGPPGVPVTDGFSARYGATIDFDPGTYQLSARADDGVRVYVDGRLIIDQWRDSSGDRAHKASIKLDGEHDILVEHYDNIGDSFIKFSYQRTGD